MTKPTIAVLCLFILVVALIFGFTYRNPYDARIRVLSTSQIFPDGPWRVIYEQNGNQYSQNFRTRADAETWIGGDE